MTELDLARSHVERCLQDLWHVRRPEPDADGNYPYKSGSAACWIGIDAGDPPIVKAVACAVVGVKKSTKLLAELNTRCRTAHIYSHEGTVVVQQSMLAHVVDRRSLSQAGQSVAAVANDIGSMIAAVFGGHTPIATLDQIAG